MLALCWMLLATYYAQNYAGIIGWSLQMAPLICLVIICSMISVVMEDILSPGVCMCVQCMRMQSFPKHNVQQFQLIIKYVAIFSLLISVILYHFSLFLFP